MPDQVDWRAVQGEGNPARAVGRLLRDQREELGLSLSDVGQRLRIRRPYIEAIEEGRFDLLPGAAYIPAFLRAYSVHLGLDPQKVLTAYQTSGAVPIERPKGLPADFPLPERRTPYGLAVLTLLLLIAAGYAVWHFMPQQTPVIAQKVPPVPDRLLAERPSSEAQRPASDVAIAAPPSETRAVETTRAPQTQTTQPAPAEMWPLPKSETLAPPSAVTIAPLPAPPPAATQTASPPPPVATVAPPSPIPPGVAAPAPAQPTPAATVGQAQAAQPPGPRIDLLRGPPPAPVEPQDARLVAPRDERAEASKPVLHDTPIGVRVDSWVELRSANGEVLAQTYVRAGESYTIPAGIAFRVINAR
jgi:cytoskeleton protein RodZ